jgi:hypothetical protein
MTITTRMFPISGATVSVGVPPNPAPVQKVYAATAGGFIDAAGDPQSGDAAALGSQGFVAVGTSGITANRPPNPTRGSWHVDTTLGYAVTFDGTYWRNPITGASV